MDNTETQPTLGTRHRTKTKKQPKNMTQKEKNGLYSFNKLHYLGTVYLNINIALINYII
jgi:hypothetical protein